MTLDEKALSLLEKIEQNTSILSKLDRIISSLVATTSKMKLSGGSGFPVTGRKSVLRKGAKAQRRGTSGASAIEKKPQPGPAHIVVHEEPPLQLRVKGNPSSKRQRGKPLKSRDVRVFEPQEVREAKPRKHREDRGGRDMVPSKSVKPFRKKTPSGKSVARKRDEKGRFVKQVKGEESPVRARSTIKVNLSSSFAPPVSPAAPSPSNGKQGRPEKSKKSKESRMPKGKPSQSVEALQKGKEKRQEKTRNKGFAKAFGKVFEKTGNLIGKGKKLFTGDKGQEGQDIIGLITGGPMWTAIKEILETVDATRNARLAQKAFKWVSKHRTASKEKKGKNKADRNFNS